MKLRTYCLACRKHKNKVVRDKNQGVVNVYRINQDLKKKNTIKKVVTNIIKQTC